MAQVAQEDPLAYEPLVSVEFEVFGKVQGKRLRFNLIIFSYYIFFDQNVTFILNPRSLLDLRH